MNSTIARGLTFSGCLFACLLGASQSQQSLDPTPKPFIRSVDGSTLYKAYCAVCHGTDGKGGGPMAGSLKVRPSDLTHIATRNYGVFPTERVEKLISGDEQVLTNHGVREMPIWGPVFSQIEWDRDLSPLRLRNLAKYIEELQAR